MAQERGWLLLTNDDGIEAMGLETLVKALHDEGYPRGCAGAQWQSFSDGHAHQFDETHGVPPRDDLVERWGLNPHTTPVHLFELDGTPCDTMIVALDGGLNHLVPGVHPQMVVSGVNLGPNLSQDSYHSGTMGAAREAGLYGVPAIAASFTSFDPVGMERAVEATLDIVAAAAAVLPVKAGNLARPKALSRRPTSPRGQNHPPTSRGVIIPNAAC